jgi:hypothetical protein
MVRDRARPLQDLDHPAVDGTGKDLLEFRRHRAGGADGCFRRPDIYYRRVGMRPRPTDDLINERAAANTAKATQKPRRDKTTRPVVRFFPNSWFKGRSIVSSSTPPEQSWNHRPSY